MSTPRQRHLWTPDEVALLRLRYADTLNSDLAATLGLPVVRVLAKANALGLKKSRDLIASVARERSNAPGHGFVRTQFAKGNVPANKGQRRPGWSPGGMARTQFKAGHRPQTWVPVGSYRLNADGNLEVKLNDLPGRSDVRWMPVHRLVWAQADMPVPPGYVLVYKPGRQTTDPARITVDALELVTRAELMRRNSIHHLPPQLAEVSRLRGSVTRAINQRSRKDTP